MFGIGCHFVVSFENEHLLLKVFSQKTRGCPARVFVMFRSF